MDANDYQYLLNCPNCERQKHYADETLCRHCSGRYQRKSFYDKIKPSHCATCGLTNDSEAPTVICRKCATTPPLPRVWNYFLHSLTIIIIILKIIIIIIIIVKILKIIIIIVSFQ